MLTPFILLAGWIFAVLQGTVLYPLRAWGAGPDLILIGVAFYAVKNGVTVGTWAGFCLGMMMDIFSGMPFGFHTLLYTATGAGIGFVSRFFYWRSWASYSVAVLLAGAFLQGVSWVLWTGWAGRGSWTFTPLSWKAFLWMSLINAAAAPWLFSLFDLWERFRSWVRDHLLRSLGMTPEAARPSKTRQGKGMMVRLRP